MLGAALLWGTVGPAQVLAESEADPGALGVARLLIGGAALAALSSRGSAWRQLLRRDVIGWLLLAALATGVYQVAFMHAVDQLGAALGTAIALGVAPVVTGLCARWWTHDRMTLGWAAGTAAAIIGCTVLLDPWGAEGVAGTGVAVALVSGACYGVYTVAAKRFLSTGVPALPATSFTLILAGVLLSPIIVLNPAHLADADSLLLIGWIGLAGTALAYALFVYGLRRTTAGRRHAEPRRAAAGSTAGGHRAAGAAHRHRSRRLRADDHRTRGRHGHRCPSRAPSQPDARQEVEDS